MEGLVAEKSVTLPSTSSSSKLVQRCSMTSSRPQRPVREPYDYDQKLKRHQAQKLVLRRALLPAPPRRRQALRWLNFRPTPSRLSRMSPA
uniref:Uncharacterized protein n=1 Tax=Kalanchoe fedtschenkoi TaxID=63787 RepID=A0A7N0RFY5_KALFE